MSCAKAGLRDAWRAWRRNGWKVVRVNRGDLSPPSVRKLTDSSRGGEEWGLLASAVRALS